MMIRNKSHLAKSPGLVSEPTFLGRFPNSTNTGFPEHKGEQNTVMYISVWASDYPDYKHVGTYGIVKQCVIPLNARSQKTETYGPLVLVSIMTSWSIMT